MSVQTVLPADLPALAAVIVANSRAAAESSVRRLMKAVGLRFEHDSPKKTGRAQSSVQPWVGTPEGEIPEAKQAFYPMRGAPDYDAAYASWKLGEPAGVIMTVPYARRLAHGWSSQQPDGWVLHLIYDEIAAARRVA